MKGEQQIMRSRGYLSATEVAHRLDRHNSTIYRAIEAKRISGLKVGCHWYVRVDSLAGFLGPEMFTAYGFDKEQQ